MIARGIISPQQEVPPDMADTNTVLWYDRNADSCDRLYESAENIEIQDVLRRWIQPGMHVLELGCGSGRDARFMAGLGADVVATDASSGMLAKARAHGGRVAFKRLAMPCSASELQGLGLIAGDGSAGSFDAVVSIAMIMHLTDSELFSTAKAIDRLATERGIVILSFCSNHPADSNRRYEPRTAQSVRLLMEDFGFACVENTDTSDSLGRGILWHTLVLVRNAAPRNARKHLQSVIYEDQKTATYKLALLRALCDISQSASGHLRFEDEECVSIPLGLVIEKWIEYYWPLLSLPQIHQGRRTGFDAELRKLVALFGESNYAEFRKGLESNTLGPDALDAFRSLASSMRTTLVKGPIQYSGGASKKKTFAYKNKRIALCGKSDPLSELTNRNGRLIFSGDLWSELRDCGRWLSDSIVLQWADLIARFSQTAGIAGNTRARIIAALTEADEATRDTSIARALYAQRSPLHCAWSGRAIRNGRFDVDHILPWSLSHCNSLWNLVPAEESVNRKKSDKLLDSDFFYSRREAVIEDWGVLIDQGRNAELFLAQARHTLAPDGLPASGWEGMLIECIARELESAASRLQLERWRP